MISGLRLFTANDAPERDPADYVIEGSNDGGVTFTPITTGTVVLPDDRNAAGLAINPMTQFNREVNFPNATAYTTYRFFVNNVKNNATANSMQVGEVQLLAGKPSGPVVITFSNLGNGQLQLQWSHGTLESAGTVGGAYTTVAGAASPWPVSSVAGTQFFRVKVE